MVDKSDQTQAEKLAEPFPANMLRYHQGKKLTYVPVSEVIAKLNRVLGTGNWSYEVIRVWESGEQETLTGTYPKWIQAHVRLRALVDFSEATKDGVGGQEVKLLKKRDGADISPGVVDLGDEYKGAMSDALKKAAQGFGVGLELAREDDAMAWERAEREADEPKANEQTLNLITEHAKALDEEASIAFRKWWATSIGKKISSGLVTLSEADAALEYLGLPQLEKAG